MIPLKENFDPEPENFQPDCAFSTPRFSPEVISQYEERFENGYDIYTDTNYITWLQELHPDCVPNLSDMFVSVMPFGALDTLILHQLLAVLVVLFILHPLSVLQTVIYLLRPLHPLQHPLLAPRKLFTSSILSSFCSIHSQLLRKSCNSSVHFIHSSFCSIHS